MKKVICNIIIILFVLQSIIVQASLSYVPASTSSLNAHSSLLVTQTSLLFYHSDHLSSLSVMTDVNGNVAQEVKYYPYGETRVLAMSNEQRTISSENRQQSKVNSQKLSVNYWYTGQEEDPETSLYYYGARYYDQRIAQFISVDPEFGNFPYAYANNNPLRFVDQYGRDPEDWRFVAGMIAGTSPFYDPKVAPKDFAFLWGATAGSVYRMLAGAAATVGGGVSSIGSPPTAVATVPLTFIAAGIAVDGYYDTKGSLKAALEARGQSDSSSSGEWRKPTVENGYYGPEGGWPSGKVNLDRQNSETLAPLWGKSKHPVLQSMIRNGLIYDNEGKIANGLYMFNIDGEGNIFFNNADLEQTTVGRRLAHSSLIGGDNSFGAGYLECENGIILRIADYSGHYSYDNPTFKIENFKPYMKNLLDNSGAFGVNKIEFMRFSEVGK